MNPNDNPSPKAFFKANKQVWSPTTQKIQAIKERKKEEWEVEAELNQNKQNTKKYLNLTKQSEEQGKAIVSLEARVQELEKSRGIWKYIIMSVLLLAILEIFILFKFAL